MKKLAMVVMAAAMSFGLTGCIDDLFGSDDCSYYGTSGGCSSSIPYSCPSSSLCSSSPSCSNINC